MLMATSLRRQPPGFAGEVEGGEFEDDEYIEHSSARSGARRQDLLSMFKQQAQLLQSAGAGDGVDEDASSVDLTEAWSADHAPPLPAVKQQAVLRL